MMIVNFERRSIEMKLSSQIPERERKFYKLLSLWYMNRIDGQLKPSTCRCYQTAIKHIKRFCEDIPVSEIEEEFLQNGINILAKNGYAKSTIHKARFVMNNVMLYAVRIKWLKAPPMMKLYIPKIAPTQKVDALTKFDQERIEAFCSEPGRTKYGHITLFILYTGLRSDEVYNLKWSDFHGGSKPYIEINKSKTDYGLRKVPLNLAALNIIESQPRIMPYIFTTVTGCQLSETQMKRHNQFVRESLNIKKFHNHICRHTFATRAVEKNIDIRALSKILGHSSVAFTMQRYVTIFDDYLFEQMSLLDEPEALRRNNKKSNGNVA